MNIEVVTTVPIDLDALASNLADDSGMTARNYEALLDFVMDVDLYVCDLDFTKALRDRLTEVIESEEED